MIRLYAIHDDSGYISPYPEELWCIAVWAETLREAIAIAAKNYSGDGPGPFEDLMDGEWAANQGRLAAFAPEAPGTVERRPNVLRFAGWKKEDEDTCSTCGLAACGDEDMRPCPECCQCPECGCDDDCPLRNEREP